MVFDDGQSTGNGNGNKMNLRIQTLEGLLQSMAGDGTTAKVNCLKQVIRRNKADMADDASHSLDLMRRIFQPQINEEIKQIIDRHMRTTFSPAIENLKRNGHGVNEEELHELSRSILEAAKGPYQPPVSESRRPSEAADFAHLKRGYESDSSDISAISHGSREHKRRRGRPRKEDEILFSDPQPVTSSDLQRWNPDRLCGGQKFVYAAKAAANLNVPVSLLFTKFPRMYRYICDDEDKTHLFEEKLLSKLSGKVIVLLLEDAIEMQGRVADLEHYAFVCPENVLRRMRTKCGRTQEQLKTRMQQQNSFAGFS